MTNTNAFGLDADAPDKGALADGYAVAETALVLRGLRADGPRSLAVARHAATLHRISGRLHHLDERACKEDLTCRKCDGTGLLESGPEPGVCLSCAGDGRTIGPELARLMAGAREIAEFYGFRVYHQSDPRGCSLYLVDNVPQSWAGVPGEQLEKYVYPHEAKSPPPLAKLQRRWIEANYFRGHAVVRVGR